MLFWMFWMFRMFWLKPVERKDLRFDRNRSG